MPTHDQSRRQAPARASANLAEGAYSQLKHSLMTGSLDPGTKLTIRDLAASMGISPTPVREALVQLSAEGALTQSAGRSFFVPRLDAENYDDLRLLRRLLEGEGAFRAAERATSKIIDDLWAIQKKQIEAKDRADYREALVWNHKFHLGLCAAGDSKRLFRIVEGLWVQMGPLLNLLYENLAETDYSDFGGRHPHEPVIEALHNRNPEAARTSIQADIDSGLKPILSNLKLHEVRSET